MLGRRLMSAAVIISATLLLLYFDFRMGADDWLGRPGIVLAILIGIIGIVAADELLYMLRQKCPSLKNMVPIATIVAMIVCASLPVWWRDYPPNCPVGFFGWTMLGMTVALGLCCLQEILQFEEDGNGLERLTRYGFVIIYLGIIASFLLANRLLEFDNSKGMIALVAMLATVKMSDAAAYFAGKTFGKTKLSPRLSPGKTVEGAIGSLFGAWLAAAIVFYIVAPNLFGTPIEKPWWWFLAYGAAITVAGIVGDLTESLIKRDSGVKDSSKWLPGLGGILDVIDSLAFAAPVAFFMWMVG